MTTKNAIKSELRGWIGHASARIRQLGIQVGILDYRRAVAVPSLSAWTEEYETGRWDYLRKVDQLARYILLAGYAELFSPKAILDVGCGEGLMRASVNHLEFERYLGVDPVAVAIERAQVLADERTQFG